MSNARILKSLAIVASVAMLPSFVMAQTDTNRTDTNRTDTMRNDAMKSNTEATRDAMKRTDKDDPGAVEEAATTSKIKAEMVRNKTLSAFDIEVDTQDNTVLLSGKVKTAAEKAEAERVAHSVQGVSTVKNNITIDPSI
jgi:osmotically-inducible protein OsmY